MASLPFLVWHALRVPAPPADPHGAQPGFWLTVCVAWAVWGAVFLPSLLAGDVQVYVTQRAGGSRAGVVLMPLQPASGNLTQALYALANLAVFVAGRRLLALPGGLARLRGAMGALAGLNVLAIVLNLGETYLGLPGLLSLVRNGGYAVMVGGEVGGLMRISGTFPESSAFVAFTMPVFAFHFALWLHGDRARWVGALALALGVTLAASTSTTGTLALLAYLGGVAVLRARQAASAPSARLARALMRLSAALLLAVGAVLLFAPAAAGKAAHYVDVVVGSKLSSSSGEERLAWMLQGLRNLRDTAGLGVGLGSARASSFLVVLLSNLGLVGTLTYAAFVVAVLRSAVAPGEAAQADARRIRLAAAHAFVAALCPAMISGTVFERGPAFYLLAAAASLALARPAAQAAARPLVPPLNLARA